MQNDSKPQVPSFLPNDVKGVVQDDQPAAEQPPVTTLSSKKIVIQPSATFVQEMQAQQPTGALAPATPAAPPPQPAPAASPKTVVPAPTGPATPIGLSASQMKLSDQQSPRRSSHGLKKMIAPVVVLAVLAGGFFGYRFWNGYATKTVQASGFSYSVAFSRNAKLITIKGTPYLQGDDKAGHTMVVTVVKETSGFRDCYATAGTTVSVVDTPTIDGEPHNLCYSSSLNLYDLNFKHNGAWYSEVIFAQGNKQQKLNQDTVKAVARSVKIY